MGVPLRVVRCPIRRSPPQRLLAPTRGISLLGTAFISSRAEQSIRWLKRWSSTSNWTSIRAISSRELSMSPKLHAYTPALSTGSSIRALKRRLVSGWVSCLDAFSIYPLQRGCPALPCRTTGKLVAADPCSSRTKGSFPSGVARLQKIATNLSHDGLNPAHDPL